jgi:hypothetical protein
MRTTVTIDDHLSRQLDDRMRKTGRSFKETLQELLILGLSASAKPAKQESFRIRSKRMGLRPGIDPSALHDLDTDLEVDRFLSVTRKLSGKK